MPLNLLPWREKRHRRFVMLSYIITVSILISIIFSMNMIKSSRQQTANQYTQENRQLQHLIQVHEQSISQSATCLHQAHILSHITALPNTLTHNTQRYQSIGSISDALPIAIKLTELHREDRLFTIKGIAKSTQALSAFVHNLTLCKQLHQTHLAQVSQQTAEIHFSLTTTLRYAP